MTRTHRKFIPRTTRIGIALIAVAAVLALPAAASAAATVSATTVSDITQTTAGFRATVNPQGLPTTWRFEWATDAYYDANGGTYSNASEDRLVALTIGSIAVPLLALDTIVILPVTGLSAGTEYHVRAVATQNACYGTPQQNSCPIPPTTTNGADVTFTTLP